MQRGSRYTTESQPLASHTSASLLKCHAGALQEVPNRASIGYNLTPKFDWFGQRRCDDKDRASVAQWSGCRYCCRCYLTASRRLPRHTTAHCRLLAKLQPHAALCSSVRTLSSVSPTTRCRAQWSAHTAAAGAHLCQWPQTQRGISASSRRSTATAAAASEEGWTQRRRQQAVRATAD